MIKNILTDAELIKNYKIRKKDKILDIGGAMKQHTDIRIDTLVDMIRPEEAPYTASKLKAENFVRVDITKDKLPFPDKSFDFCFCTHTLEDLYNPFLVIEEMSRVSGRGLIITPSMGKDMVFGKFDITNWMTGPVRTPGNSHHKWLFTKTDKGVLKIIPKNYGILFSSHFHLTSWKGEEEMQYYWRERIKYERVDDLNIHTLIDEYESYLRENKAKFKLGKPLIFIDNPVDLLKAYTKLILKRGIGYRKRKVIR